MDETPAAPQVIDRTPVKSSHIKSVGYHEPSRTMEIEFRSGGVCRYKGVEPEHHETFIKAESLGSAFHRNIRGKFAHEKVEQ